MSPAALLSAASITRDRAQSSLELSDLLRTCSNLVILDNELDTLRFAHVSVQEYLSRLPEFSAANANSTAAWSCLIRCIDNPLPDLTMGIQPARDFDVYAAMYWPLHYTSASEHDRDDYLEDTLKEFMFSEEDIMSPFPSWVEIVDEISKTLPGPHTRLSDLTAIGSESVTPLFTACIYGFEFAVPILSTIEAFDVNQKNARGHTGIYLASAAGRTRVVDILLKLGADVSIESGRHTTALQAACANGHGDTVQLILSFLSPNLTAETITAAVQVALRSGHENIALILLKKSALPMSPDNFDQVFEAAAGMGFTKLMDYLHLTSKSLAENKKLATRGAEKTFYDSKILRFRNFFEHKALPKDAVATAAFYGQNEIIRFCLDKGLDIENEGPFGTPLRAASLMGHGITGQLLLDRDADVNANGSFGDALHAAAMRGHLSIATTLIQNGVAVDNVGGYYGNAPQAATYRGHIEVVKALLTAGASIGQKGLFSDAMCAAVSAGNQTTVDLLVRSGCSSPHFLDQDEIGYATAAYLRGGFCPLHVDLLSVLDSTTDYERSQWKKRVSDTRAQDLSFGEAYENIHARSDSHNVTELPNYKNSKFFGPHALLVAAENGHESIVRSMLNSRSIIGLSLPDIGIVLKTASMAGQLGIVDYILSMPDPLEKHIPRALERAAWYGHVLVMRRLLECVEPCMPPNAHHELFTPHGEEARQMRMGEGGWTKYFCTDFFSQWFYTNETTENGHILMILLQGCRADAPATVEFALDLAAGSELQNLFRAALPIAVRSDSARVVEVLFRLHPVIDPVTLGKACAHAEEDESLSVLYFLLSHNKDSGHELQDYWNVFDGAASSKHSELISYLVIRTLHCQDDSMFRKRFFEAAKRGHAPAIKAWGRRLHQSVHNELVLSQALDQACANGHATATCRCSVWSSELCQIAC
jgi:ankyrin repeat protein